MNATVTEALKIMNGYDWYWYMADYGYTQLSNSAKATMRYFVKTVAQIEDSSVREALRNLWILKYNYASASVNGRELEDYEEKKNNYMNIINN